MLGLLTALAQAASLPSDALFLRAIADKEEDRALDLLRKEPKLVGELMRTVVSLWVSVHFFFFFWGGELTAEEMLNEQHERVDIPALARIAHYGLPQKRMTEDLC